MLDDPFGDLDHLGIRLHRGNVVEQGVRTAHLVESPQRIGQHALAAGLDRQQPLALVQHHPAERDAVLPRHGLADDAKGFGRELAVRDQEIGVVPIDAVDVGHIDEMLDVDGAGGLELYRVDLLLGDHDVASLVDLIPLDDVRPFDRTGFRIGGDHADAVMGALVQHVEVHVARGRGRGVERHRTGDERQAQMALPGGTGGHGLLRKLCGRTTPEPFDSFMQGPP